MPRDELSVEKKNNFGHELYGDSLYVPTAKKLPRDYNILNQEDLLSEVMNGDSSFDEILNDTKFVQFETLPYLSFNIGYDNSQFITDSPYVLVEKGWRMKMWNPSAQVIVKVFIPFSAVNVFDMDDSKIINKVILNNRSHPEICHQVTGNFRSPVAITQNSNHYRFDTANCEIYNEDWFIINMAMPAKYIEKR